MEANLHIHANYAVSHKGLQSLTAKVTTKRPREGKVVFAKDGLSLIQKRGKLYCYLPRANYLGRRLRRFLRDYVRNCGGKPRSLNYWTVPYR